MATKKTATSTYLIQDGDSVREMTPEEAAFYELIRQDPPAEPTAE